MSTETPPQVPTSQKTVNDYVELIESVAKSEYERLPGGLSSYEELVNIGATAAHVLLSQNPGVDYNFTYLSTAMRWAIRNELRRRYPNRFSTPNPDFSTPNPDQVREAVYETILSCDQPRPGNQAEAGPSPTRTDDGANTEIIEMAKVVRRTIAKLATGERKILEARFYRNMNAMQIGDAYNVPPLRLSGILNSGLNKVRDKVRDDLQKDGSDIAPRKLGKGG